MENIKKRRSVIVLSILAALNLVIIWGNSFLSFEDSSKGSSFITTLLKVFFKDADFPGLEYIVRKCAHFCEFACLGALSVLLLFCIVGFDLHRTWDYISVPVFACLLASSTDETIQIFSDRGNSVSDVLLDFSGSVTAMVIFFVTVSIMQSVKRRRAVDEEDDFSDANESEGGGNSVENENESSER